MFGNEVYIKAHLLDITEKKRVQLHLSRLLLLRESMLEATQSIVHVENIDILYKKILFNALHSIEHAKLGTILLKEGNTLKMVAQIGFEPSSIEGFQIPIKESFLFKAVGSSLNKIAKIDNVITFDDYYHFRSSDGSDDFIRSSISAPIYIKKEFFGVVNIDSHQFNAFDDDDLKMMEFVRNNVEIAISNHLLYEEKLFLARYDSMTNTYNRRYFDEMFEFIRDKAQRYGEEFNLVIFDINSLKDINDQYGHLAGDMVIQRFAKECSQMIRKCDVFARYGGDEFIGIFFESTKTTLSRRFDLLLESLKSAPVYVNGEEINFSFSYGISSFREDGIVFDDLFKVADEAMYQFKKNYKNEMLKK